MGAEGSAGGFFAVDPDLLRLLAGELHESSTGYRALAGDGLAADELSLAGALGAVPASDAFRGRVRRWTVAAQTGVFRSADLADRAAVAVDRARAGYAEQDADAAAAYRSPGAGAGSPPVVA